MKTSISPTLMNFGVTSRPTTPRGTLIAETAHYGAFEVSSEQDANGFVVLIYRKTFSGYDANETATCMVRAIVCDRLNRLEKDVR